MCEPDRFLSIPGFSNDFKIRLDRKKRAQTFAEKRLIINQENPDWFHVGNSTSNENPLPGSVFTRTTPFKSCTRSRTPSKQSRLQIIGCA
jgi:hypothetical protein